MLPKQRRNSLLLFSSSEQQTMNLDAAQSDKTKSKRRGSLSLSTFLGVSEPENLKSMPRRASLLVSSSSTSSNTNAVPATDLPEGGEKLKAKRRGSLILTSIHSIREKFVNYGNNPDCNASTTTASSLRLPRRKKTGTPSDISLSSTPDDSSFAVPPMSLSTGASFSRVRFMCDGDGRISETVHVYGQAVNRGPMYWSVEELEEMEDIYQLQGRQSGRVLSCYSNNLRFLYTRDPIHFKPNGGGTAADLSSKDEDFSKKLEQAIVIVMQTEDMRGLERYACRQMRENRTQVVDQVVEVWQSLSERQRQFDAVHEIYSKLSQRSVDFALCMAQGDAAEAKAVWNNIHHHNTTTKTPRRNSLYHPDPLLPCSEHTGRRRSLNFESNHQATHFYRPLAVKRESSQHDSIGISSSPRSKLRAAAELSFFNASYGLLDSCYPDDDTAL